MSAAADENAARLIGPDSNKNGIRDDIDEYIDSSYPDRRQHAAMVQFAAAYGLLLVDGGVVAGAREATKGVVRAIQCGIEVFGNFSMVKQKRLLAMMLNNEERFAAYARAQKNEEGQVFDRFQGEACL
ncbi:hypothetical protein [Paraburkholderia sp. BL21I4N1]|uniref:hypothetical protein n=1 Tax=Paraburkholderia sp. BL21I4N1 TaxID=1938801 RepID=UPI0011B21D4B|nr:hypothetical protein [Paraburkholderia sp. BL21I4N1]